MHVTGWPTLFFVIPFFIGAFLCGVSGIAAGCFLVTSVTDWIVNRIVLRYYVYADFLKLVRTSAVKRSNRDQASY